MIQALINGIWFGAGFLIGLVLTVGIILVCCWAVFEVMEFYQDVKYLKRHGKNFT